MDKLYNDLNPVMIRILQLDANYTKLPAAKKAMEQIETRQEMDKVFADYLGRHFDAFA